MLVLRDALNKIAERLGLEADLQTVLRGAGAVMLIQILSVHLNYASQLLLARWIGPSEFGSFVFAWIWVVPLGTAAAVGLSAAASRFVPQYNSAEEWGLLHGFVRRSTAIVLGSGITIALVGFLIVALVDPWMAERYVAPTRFALASVPFMALIVLQSGMARGFGWVALAFVPQMLFVPAALILGVVVHFLLIGTPDAGNTMAWVLGGCVLIACVHAYRFRRALPSPVRDAAPVFHTRPWLRVAIPLFLADGLALVLSNADTAMLAGFMQAEDVARYHAAAKTAALTYLVTNAVQAIAAPKFATLIVQSDRAAVQRFARSIAAWMFWLSAAAVACILVCGKFILSVFGSEFVAAFPVVVVLCGGYLLRTVAGPVDAYLAVSGHQDYVLLVHGVTAVVNIALNAFLIPAYGILGAAIGTVTVMLAGQAAIYLLVRRRLGLNALFFG